MKKVWYAIDNYVFIIIAVILIRTFVIAPAIVDGESMYDTLEDSQIVLINKFIYRFNDIERYDIVVVKNETDNDKIIKRVIGLPGEKIQIIDGYVFINGKRLKDDVYKDKMLSPGIAEKEITLKSNEYFVLGDNRGVSKDSRILGPFVKEDIIGRVNYRLYPFDLFGTIDEEN